MKLPRGFLFSLKGRCSSRTVLERAERVYREQINEIRTDGSYSVSKIKDDLFETPVKSDYDIEGKLIRETETNLDGTKKSRAPSGVDLAKIGVSNSKKS